MKGEFYIETERTVLRNLKIDDAEDFYSLNLDREVLKFTGDKPFENLQEAKYFPANYDQYRNMVSDDQCEKTLPQSKYLKKIGMKLKEDLNLTNKKV